MAMPGRIARKARALLPRRGVALRGRLRTRSVVLETVATTALYAVVVAVAIAFARPWLPRADPAGPSLERYAPVHDGASTLFAKLDVSGEVQSWTSQNTARTPWLGLYNELRKAPSEHLIRLYGMPDLVNVTFSDQLRSNEARGQIFTTRRRELDRAGAVTESLVVTLRDELGERLIGFYNPTDGDLLLDPPVVLLPADLEPGRAWQSEGRFGAVAYRSSAKVAEAGPFEGRDRRFEDCLHVENRFTILRGEQSLRETIGSDWYCADVGLVASEELDGGTGVATRSVLVGQAGGADDPKLLPSASTLSTPAEPGAELGDPSTWVLTRVGRARVTSDAGESTIPPIWIPGDPPLLLVAGYAGDLIALTASGDDFGTIRWRFHPAGTIFSPPAYDPEHGRIYFGAGDRRLYSLDARGLFLWSFEAGDNIATRPLVINPHPGPPPRRGREQAATGREQSSSASPPGPGGERKSPSPSQEEGLGWGSLVVFGSEDGTVYALDAETGQERWRASAGGPVVSAPMLVGGVVAIGSDDGTVFGLDVATGEQRWRYTAGGAIEAAVVADEAGTLYVASRDGTLAAVDPSACDQTCEASWEAKVGGLLRQAPAIGAGRAFVVDDGGHLIAFETESGRRLWSTPQPSYAGTPALVGEALIVSRKDGDVAWVDGDGVEQKRWSGADASGPVDARPQLAHGPAVGGGALWLADDGAVIRRLGPPDAVGDAVPLRATLARRASQPPFDGGLLIYTPVEYQDLAVVLDPSRNVHLLDPDSGRGVRLGTVPGDSIVWPTEPVVAGDTLLVTVGTTLQALDLPSGGARWSFPGGPISLRAPTVAGDTVLWLTAAPGGADGGPAGAGIAPAGGARGVLYALGLADGQPRWQLPLDGYLSIGGVLEKNGTAYLSTPPSAVDLASGAQRWRADPSEPGGLALGGPALDAAGETVFVGLVDPGTGLGRVAALDTRDGRMRWRVDLGSESLRDSERVWLDGDTVVVPSVSGTVIGLEAATGRERWRYRPTAPRLGSVSVIDGRAWLVLEDAQIIGLDVQTGRPALFFRDLNVSLNGQGINQRPNLVAGKLLVAVGRMLLGFPLP
jgi:outer membrane protein assembly factor BamB